MKNKKWLENILTNSVKIIFLIIIFYLIVVSICYSCSVNIYETTIYSVDSVLKNMLIILSVILICKGIVELRVKSGEKIKRIFSPIVIKKIVFVVIILWTLTSLIWILSTQLQPRADQYFVLDAASRIANGDMTPFDKGNYIHIYPNQSGIILFFNICVLVLGNYNYIAIQILNVLAILISYYFIYKSYEILFYSKKEEKPIEKSLIILSLFFFIQMIFYTTFVYGNFFGLMFSVIAIYFELSFIKKEKVSKLIISFLSIIVASLIKMNYLITMIAMIILLLYEAIINEKYKYIIYSICLVALYLLGNKLVRFTMEEISNKELTDGIPMLAWVEMSLQDGGYSSGWFNGYVVNVFVENNYNTILTKVQVKEDFRNTLNQHMSNPNRFITYMNRKVISQWTNPTFQCFWINQNRRTNLDVPNWSENIIKQKGMYNVLVQYMDIMETIILFGTLIYIVINFKNIKFKEMFFAIVFIGGFIFHIIWEAKCQYTITYFILIIPYAVKGYSTLIEQWYLDMENGAQQDKTIKGEEYEKR